MYWGSITTNRSEVALLGCIPDHLTEDGSGLLYGTLTQEGYFEFEGIPPSHYHAVAGENFLLYANPAYGGDFAWSDPQFLRPACWHPLPQYVAG